MPTLGHSLLLDTSVVVKHFREPATVTDKLASADGLYLPQPALGALYHGQNLRTVTLEGVSFSAILGLLTLCVR
jgi:predicted nucleic acid-binding protein